MNAVQHAVHEIQVAVEGGREDGDPVVGQLGLEAELERIVSRAYCKGAAMGEVWRLHTLRQLYVHHRPAALRVLGGEDLGEVLREVGADEAIGRSAPVDRNGPGHAAGPGSRHRDPAVSWYRAMKSGYRDQVQAWLRENPPPDDWHGTRIQYAFEHMPGMELGVSRGTA